MPKVFISYRREDSQHQADRLHLALRRVMSRRDIFIDIDNIPAGVDFVQHLDQKVAQCDVLLALIGPDWLNASADGKRRLDDPKDFVRVEIASALKRGIPVAPVLLDGAPMPRETELPDDLKPLIRRNGLEVRRNSFDADAKRLIERLEVAAAGGGTLRWALPVAAVVVVGAAVGGWYFLTRENGSTPEKPLEVAGPPVLSITQTPTSPADMPVLLPPAVPEKGAALTAPGPAAAVTAPEPAQAAPVPAASPPAPACLDCPETSRQKLKSGASITVSSRITQAQWSAFCADFHCPVGDDGTDTHLPVTAVNWTQVDQYIRWLSGRSGRKYRLPASDELDSLLGDAPGAGDPAGTEWTRTCHTGTAPQCTYEVRGWDAKGKRVLDWYSSDSKGKTLGFRVVVDK